VLKIKIRIGAVINRGVIGVQKKRKAQNIIQAYPVMDQAGWAVSQASI